MNFPKVKSSSDNKLINFADVGSLSSNSSTSSFNPSSFSATLTESLATLQQAQQNSFKTANLEATTATIGSLTVQSKLDISSTVFQNSDNYPAASQTTIGFTQRAQQSWENLTKGEPAWDAQVDRYISPHDLDDWATKNAFITTNPLTWPIGNADIPAAGSYNSVSNAGSVTDAATLKLTSNFTFTPIGSSTDSRWSLSLIHI